jgi:hypothetical protein
VDMERKMREAIRNCIVWIAISLGAGVGVGESLLSIAEAQTAQLRPGSVWGNPTTGTAPGRDSTMSGIMGPRGAIYVSDYGTYSNFINDDGAAIQSALNEASAQGGGIVYLPAKTFWSSTTNITIPKHVTLKCAISAQLNIGLNPQNIPCSIYLKAPYYVILNGEIDSVNVFDDQVHFYSRSWTRASMKAFIAQFSRTGIAIGNGVTNSFVSDGAIAHNILVGGFATCITSNAADHVKLHNILGDCTNGLDISQSFDDNFLSHIEFWPFLTSNQPHTFDSWNISGIADNGLGAWRITTATTNDIATGERLWISSSATGQGALGLYTVTSVDANNVDLQSSVVSPSTTGNTTTSSNYVTVASTANINYGMSVSGVGIPAGAFVQAVWRSRNAIQLDEAHAATANGTGVTLSFGSTPYVSGKVLSYDGTFRFGTGFRLGRADGTSCEACFAFGYLVGFDFNNAQGVVMVNSQYDSLSHAANFNAVPTAIQFTGTINSANRIEGNIITCSGVAILSNYTGGSESYNNIVTGFKGGSAVAVATYLELSSGGVSLIGNSTGAAYNILLDNTANTAVLTGNTMVHTRVFGTGTDASWVGSANLFSGNLGLQAPSTVIGQKIQAAGGSNGGAPIIDIYDNTQAANSKYWRFTSSAGSFLAQTVDDAYTTPVTWLSLGRTGTTPLKATFGVSVDVGSNQVVGANIKASGTSPDLQFYASGAGVDQKYWDMFESAGGNLTLRSLNDAFSLSNPWLQFVRGSGYTVGTISFFAPITGGAAASSSLVLESTSAAGTTDSVVIKTGSQVQAGVFDTKQHFQPGNSTAPTIASAACGALTNGTIGAGSNDQAMLIQIGAAATTSCAISFAGTWTAAPRACEITPANAAAAAQGTTGAYVSAISTTTLTITGTALAGANYYAHCY